MRRMNPRLLATLLLGLPVAAGAVEPTGTAVEFYHPGLAHYFITPDASEIAGIEAGAAGPGWKRTGGQFGVYRSAGDVPGLSPVCRFYGTPGVGPNSHFYTPDPAECESVKRSAGWTYEGIAFYIAQAVGGRCAPDQVPVYRSYNNGAARNDSNHRYTVDATVFEKSSSIGHVREGVAMCAPLSAADKAADAVRLLRQASFGPTPSEVARIAAMGAQAWVDEQLALPSSPYPDYAWTPANRPDTCVDDRTQPVRADSYCARDNYTLFQLQLEFFRKALTQPDQLRARVAFALSQIMVTSGVDNSRNYAMRHYQQMLADRAFGNYHDLLAAVTVSPMMGDYLDMANNNKANAASGTEPNENYARELLQLFSIGTYLLNPDGTRQLDASGRPRFAYEQAQVEGFARVFTGWTYPVVAGATSRSNNPRNYLGEMVPVDANHEFGVKTLLGGVSAPANVAMRDDLAFAHRNVFEHGNVGPFIGRQLIQKLVTSNPSPAYVQRISAVFANNGAGQRGDLRAVVRAILLDPEARGARKIDPAYGKIVEPALYLTQVGRALGMSSDGVYLRTQSSSLGQNVFYSPSVFNYFPAGYVVSSVGLPGPEFGLQTTATTIGRTNFATGLIFTNAIAADTTVYGATGTRLDLARYQALAGDPGALADRLDADLLNGTMSPAMKQAIVTAVNAVAASSPVDRARTAAFLVVSSPQYQVQR
jgi:uncharacterized protein (DUF1800 family)